SVPVSIGHLFDAAGNQGLNSADVVLTYDPTVFTVSNTDVGQGALLANPPPNGTWTFTPNTTTPGAADISVTSSALAGDRTNQAGTAGGTITVPVNISNPDPNGSAGMIAADAAILYDPNVLSVAATGAVTAGSVVPSSGWNVLYGVDVSVNNTVDPTKAALGL